MATTRDNPRAGTQTGSLLIVVHDFKARSADELSLAKGDRIELIERDDDFNDGWFLGRHTVNGMTGLFPEVYTTLAPKQNITQPTGALRRTSGSMPSAIQAQESTSAVPRPASASTFGTQQRPSSGTNAFSPNNLATRSSLPAISSDVATPNLVSAQSPVMHETLTVIDEHMNDMNPAIMRNGNRRDTMGSMYSSHPNRMSYIAGHETEDEEGQMYSEAEILKWAPSQVAEYLEDHGVEKAHCQVFKEQEITGEVLLAMDQSSVFLKEFELGAVGRRLRTWHKIKALQEEAQRASAAKVLPVRVPPKLHELDASEATRTRSTSASVQGAPKTVAPLRSSTTSTLAQPVAQTSSTISQTNSAATSPLLSPRTNDTYRPSAQNVRTMQHWRQASRDSSVHSLEGGAPGHRKHSSTDQRQANGNTNHHSYTGSAEADANINRAAIFGSPANSSPSDLDKGYFSSTEVESRARKANVLQKKPPGSTAGSTHSRSGSFMNYVRRSNPPTNTESLADLVSPMSASDLTFNDAAKAGSSRTISMPTYGSKTMNTVNEAAHPVVTKLEPSSSPRSGAASRLSGAAALSGDATPPNTSASKLPFFSKTSKIPGMRAISDAVTRHEKKDSELPSPTKDGMRTPSTGAASFELKPGSRTSAGSSTAVAPPQPAPRRTKARTKKSTSAYTKGLEKKPPAEQIVDCDYSGWMKKKSGSLMTTWKPRLFVLKGRRLSYYYSENDLEEKGLIDISFHNVMPAMDERLTNVHAAVTGAGGAQPTDSDLTTTAQAELAKNPPVPGLEEDDGLFIFKLTPPKAGRGVNFTKPTVHYFAVNSRQEGRLWMAALMKAVIARDVDSVVQTTYNQATISLAKARARKERPPALQDGNDVPGFHASKDGLGIDGLKTSGVKTGSVDGTDRSFLTEDTSSVAPSSVVTAAPSITTSLGEA